MRLREVPRVENENFTNSARKLGNGTRFLGFKLVLFTNKK